MMMVNDIASLNLVGMSGYCHQRGMAVLVDTYNYIVFNDIFKNDKGK